MVMQVVITTQINIDIQYAQIYTMSHLACHTFSHFLAYVLPVSADIESISEESLSQLYVSDNFTNHSARLQTLEGFGIRSEVSGRYICKSRNERGAESQIAIRILVNGM